VCGSFVERTTGIPALVVVENRPGIPLAHAGEGQAIFARSFFRALCVSYTNFPYIRHGFPSESNEEVVDNLPISGYFHRILGAYRHCYR